MAMVLKKLNKVNTTNRKNKVIFINHNNILCRENYIFPILKHRGEYLLKGGKRVL